MNRSKIKWTDVTWNLVTGCTKISEGCKNCYAEVMTRRLKAMGQEKYKDGFDKVVCHDENMLDPYKWKNPQMVFVNSMSDLFHEDVPDLFILRIFWVMSQNPQHTFQVLTKRPSRLKQLADFLSWTDNIWMGVTIENQEQANARIPHLLRTGAKVKFVSIEPMLGPIDFYEIQDGNQYYHALKGVGDISVSQGFPNGEKIDWVICGGETGPKARPMNPEWVRSVRNQCNDAKVPFFFKQWGTWKPKYKDNENDFMTKSYLNDNIDWLDGRQYHEWPEKQSK